MAYLYCEEHGKLKEATVKKTCEQDSEEYTKIAKGKLISPCICDECNKRLYEDDVAYFVGFYLIGQKKSEKNLYLKNSEVNCFK